MEYSSEDDLTYRSGKFAAYSHRGRDELGDAVPALASVVFFIYLPEDNRTTRAGELQWSGFVSLEFIAFISRLLTILHLMFYFLQLPRTGVSDFAQQEDVASGSRGHPSPA